MCNTNFFPRVNVPYRLSVVAMAVIGINAVTLSNSAWAEDAINLDAITVTGEKVDKDIKDTTTAVTVITEDQYESGKKKDINDIITEAPNVTTGAFGTVNIRGVNSAGAAIGANAFMTGGSPRVSTVVDGITETWGGYNFNPTDVWDSKQVEVLRGPQSTSQGDNAIGGAVVLETNDPTNYTEASVRAGLESYDNGNIKHNVAAMVSGPLVKDELSARVAIDHTKGDGYIDYEDDDGDGEDLSESESLNARVKLLWTPSSIEGLRVKVTGVHRENDGEYLNWVNNSNYGTTNRVRVLNADDNENTRTQDSQVNSISTNIDYDISEEVKNQLQISYNDYTASFQQYPDDLELTLTEKKTTMENKVIFSPNDSKLSGFFGFYVSQADSTLEVLSEGSSAYDSDGTKTNVAGFGEITYAATDKWDITAGSRLEHEKQDRDLTVYTNLLEDNTEDTYFLPKVSTTYDITEATTLGASVTKGYNSGGAALQWWDGTSSSWEYYTFDPETVITYEISSKTRLNNKLTINASAFYNDYNDYQAYTDYKLENVKKAHTYGAEIEIVALATKTLELRASAGTLKTKVDETSSDTSSWQGNELSYSPDLNVGLGFTKYIGQSWSIGADSTYVTSYYSDMDNTASQKAGNYVTTNAFLQYTYDDLTINGYINNLTNEDIIYQRNDTTASIGASRTIGLSATYRL